MNRLINNYRVDIIISIVISILVFSTYRLLLWSYFQQDEWYSLGQVMSGGLFAGLTTYSPLYYLAGYIRFFGTLFNNSLHYFFPFNPLPFAVAGIILHTVNSILVYILTCVLSKKRFIACVAGIFFAVTTVHQQALTWFAAITNALPSLLFALLSLIMTVLGTKQRHTKLILLGQLLLIVSYIFKESSVFFFLFLPAYYLYVNKCTKESIVRSFRIFWPTILYLFYVICLRFYILFSPTGKVGVFISNGNHGPTNLITNLISYPLIGFSQTFVPSPLMTSFVMHIYNHVTYYELIHSMDIISIILSLILILVMIYVGYKNKARRVLLAGGVMISLFSFMPLSVLNRDNTSYLDSRYYYVSSLGVAIILGVFSYQVLNFILVKRSFKRFICAIIIVLVLCGYTYKNMSLTRAFLLQQNIESSERKNLIHEITTMFPKPAKNPIFLISGDSLGYYGVAEQKIPLQQGTGFTLMTLYFNQGIVPNSMLDKASFWNIRDQGYVSEGGKSFGYFSSLEMLKKEFETNSTLSPEQVYAAYWYSSQKKLENITESVRKELR